MPAQPGLAGSQKVARTAATQFMCISDVVQGNAIDQCVGTQIYAKSIYIQVECKMPVYVGMATNQIIEDPPNVNNLALMNRYLYTTNNDDDVAFGYPELMKHGLCRVIVIQDRCPNGTLPSLADVYKANQNSTIASTPVNSPPNNTFVPGSSSTLMMLDRDKTRRFKVLWNELVSVNFNNPQVHVEKYIPLNFYIQYSGNVGNQNHAHMINNGIYALVVGNSPIDNRSNDYDEPYFALTANLS